jgi:3-methylcrotonyl-CoA carboxylase alpha subunit
MRLVCGDQTIDVEVRDGDGEVEPLGPGVFLFRQGDRREVFHCVRDGDTVHLFWGGRAYRLEEETERSRRAHRHVGGGLEAPMPGKVIAVKVAPGDTVMKGDELLVVEAMKMENAVRAPREGRVKSVSAQVGDMVSPGVVLVELE